MSNHFEGLAHANPPKSAPSSLSEALSQGASERHAFVHAMLDRDSPPAAADLADVAHFICLLHGRYPGLIDYAATRSADPELGKWLASACEGFAGERALLTKLTVAAGPIASTPGQDQCTPAIIALRSALNNLSQSDRNGCAVGAAFALAIDWTTIRAVLEIIARRVGMEARECQLPELAETVELAGIAGQDRLIERAMAFGAAQMLQQHQLFWDMLAARRTSRRILDGY
ncbi:MAG: hypothetical protein R3E02_04935 [Blastomonas sp.]